VIACIRLIFFKEIGKGAILEIRKAPEGRYNIVGFDLKKGKTYDCWKYLDFGSPILALRIADQMNEFFGNDSFFRVYDDKGNAIEGYS